MGVQPDELVLNVTPFRKQEATQPMRVILYRRNDTQEWVVHREYIDHQKFVVRVDGYYTYNIVKAMVEFQERKNRLEASGEYLSAAQLFKEKKA